MYLCLYVYAIGYVRNENSSEHQKYLLNCRLQIIYVI